MITLADIDALNPCYDPSAVLGANWSGSNSDLLSSPMPPIDQVWVLTRLNQISDSTKDKVISFCESTVQNNPSPYQESFLRMLSSILEKKNIIKAMIWAEKSFSSPSDQSSFLSSCMNILKTDLGGS